MRRQVLTRPDQVIVYVGRSYDVMSLAEFVTYLARPPSGKLDDVVRILSPSRSAWSALRTLAERSGLRMAERYAFSLDRDGGKLLRF